ncbi:tripartite motif-containing protein [Anaeramoeba flamelloides]|uniref:Tripartite motif-containing protein n=1 Tax=Anaeramoeba flamelloides TaxID=1746091 RepID=A0ABQ8XAL4_9EUKA|nr:tripartite motif-containing protein [Anaeramoeba flamelloides]
MNQTNKNKKETKKINIKKEEEKIQKESKNNEKNVPIGLSSLRRIKCEVCSKEDAGFYCSQCPVYYCQNCEAQVHTPFWKKKHQKFIAQDIFIENQDKKSKKEPKETNNNRCPKHKKKFKFYCEEEDQLICPTSIEYCLDQKHSLLSLNSKSNEIFQKMQIILNEIQTKEKENQETIQKSQQNKKKFKIKIQEISQQIERESDLLKQQIDKSKNQHLQLLKTIQIIIENQFNKKIQNNEKSIQKINQDKTKMQKISKLKTKNKNIELINESKELINEFKEKEKLKFKLSKEIFDPKMNYQNMIKLKNQNQTAWNASRKSRGIILGQTQYSTGKHKIKIKIDQFTITEIEDKRIYLGVINTENREKLIRNADYKGSYYFETFWDKKLIQSSKKKKENGKEYSEKYPKYIKLKENDILEILLDMNQKTIAFKVNKNNCGIAWENLPESVHFFAFLSFNRRRINENIQITLI